MSARARSTAILSDADARLRSRVEGLATRYSGVGVALESELGAGVKRRLGAVPMSIKVWRF
jgi:hypothetical protein